MKTNTLTTGFVFVACMTTLAFAPFASAQSVRHNKMDERAARADIQRLQKERRKAVKYKNWGKVAQDDRLIASDKFWIRKYAHRIQHAHA